MVKVQQLKPKSLNKLEKVESNGIKKKSIEKPKKSASSLNAAKTQKKLLIEKELKVAEIVEPLKKDKKAKKKNVSEEPATAAKSAIEKGKKKPEKASSKKEEKSLALAPPESSVAVIKPIKGGKGKKADKAPVILAPPESPVLSEKPMDNQKRKKAGKAPLILAPTESPSPAPIKKVAKVNKEKKVDKAPFILAPLESPSPVPANKKASKVKKDKKENIQKAPLIMAPPESPAPATATKTKNDKKVGKKTLILPTPESPVQRSAPTAAKPAAVSKPAKENNLKITVKSSTVLAPPQTASVTPAAKPTKPRQSKAAIKKAKKAAEATNAGVSLPAKKSVKASDETAKPLTKKQKTNRVKRAYMKEKHATKLTAQAADDKKPKKKRTITYEPVEFDETKFQQVVNLENVLKIATALKAQVADEVKKQKTSIFTDFRYFLNVASFKIANVPRRMVKLSLKHSQVGEDDDVAIIVPDLQRGAKVDYDPTIQHYEDLFREAGVERLKIIPFNQLRNEMNSFETKRKFCNTYDYYLCDGRLSGQAHALLGSYTQKPRAVLHAVRLVKENLKSEIERALCRTAYRQLQKGDLISIPIGNYHFTEEQIAENILNVVQQLKTLHAGGLANARSMHLKIDIKGTSSLPIYISMSVPPADTPYVIGPREQRMLKLKSDANKVLAQFTLTKDATLLKLDPTQVENKRKLREAHAALTQNGNIIPEVQDAGENISVPAKKARIEKNDKNKEEKPQIDEDKKNLGVVDDGDDDNEDNGSDEENEDESIEDDDDEEEEDDDEEDEEDEDEDEEEDDEE